MLTLTRVAACFVLAAVALAANFSAARTADDYPARPVRIIVGFGPGSTADYSARTVAQKLSLKFGQQFVVESRAGAGSNLAAEYVARAPRDGYTLLMGTVANTINAIHLEAQLRLRQGLCAGRARSPRCRTSWSRIPRPASAPSPTWWRRRSASR